MAAQPSAPVPHVSPDTVILTIGDEKITAADWDHMIDMIPEQYRNQMRTSGRRQFAERIIGLKVMAQDARRHTASRRAAAVEQQDPVQYEIEQKAERGPGQDDAGAVEFGAEVDRLGKQIEKRDADDGAGAETQDEMQFIAQPERHQSADQGAEECRGGDAYQ